MLALLEDFRRMVNECIREALKFETESGLAASRKRLSFLCYPRLSRYMFYSQYRLTAITKASGILSARRKSIKRGMRTKIPYVSKPFIISCYSLKIQDGKLRVPLAAGRSEYIPLSPHTQNIILSDPTVKIRSFTLTLTSVSISYSKEVKTNSGITDFVGIDRNVRNVTAGNSKKVTYFDVTRAVEIAETTRNIVASFKRNDSRIRRQIASKYGKRQTQRIRQIIHAVTKEIVVDAKANHEAIVFEEISGIRSLYRKGNGQGKKFRARMNSWPFREVKRQVEYKAAWEEVPVVTLSKRETRRTTMDCPRCGERLQEAVRDDLEHYRQLWCPTCRRWWERDTVAVLNISRRGRLRFDSSQQKEGEAREAMKGTAEYVGEPLILRVDASKLHHAGRSMQ